MIAGCYIAHFCCDMVWGKNATPLKKGEVASCGWEKDMIEITGRTQKECIREVKKLGWSVTRQYVFCPKHAGRRRHLLNA